MTPTQYHNLVGCLFLIGALICPHRNSLRQAVLAGAATFHFVNAILSKF